ncbi:CAP domain-containing protein [Roseobacter denitrificans]|uniref:SCP-like extracellular protein subfamily, putative n=1 Tax=Roseobacter denitrificans (strain ATCC 33942 / OCh 114) TaxID=375451 RepID=Q16A88_ROSDO|nr:CAP domain-containing protein [Roseobacter denitrificans]ABG31105.1 SCP-like extracellular protein subfamily, putative [Roseobacter denitrificans OCh 114]AVL54176.1 CAP domain-containing protein [Roseobacter denitrificans]SFG32794.1 Cysteine-rich secretory protein family protein [Roseobacter denitrificans OCh 114]
MSQANKYEQQMLDLINADRAKVGLDPLVFNSDLNEAGEDHSAWMLDNDRFSHTGADGSNSRERIEASGYELEGNWKTGENIAWVNEAGDNGLSDEVARLHTNLMNSPEHRANLLNPDFKEIGIGIEAGDFVDDGQTLDAVFVTQNFGTTSANTVVLPDADTDAPSVVEPTPAVVEDTAPAEPEVTESEITAGTGFDIEQFMASRGFSIIQETTEDVEETSTGSSNTQTTRSSVEVTSVASGTDGPSVDVQGEGNFSGQGSATVDDVTAEDAGSAAIAIPSTQAPIVSRVRDEGTGVCDDAGAMELGSDDFVFEFGPNVRTESGSTISSASIRSLASSENGPTVEVLAMEGDTDLFGAASSNGETQNIALSMSASSDLASFSGPEFFDEYIF